MNSLFLLLLQYSCGVLMVLQCLWHQAGARLSECRILPAVIKCWSPRSVPILATKNGTPTAEGSAAQPDDRLATERVLRIASLYDEFSYSYDELFILR